MQHNPFPIKLDVAPTLLKVISSIAVFPKLLKDNIKNFELVVICSWTQCNCLVSLFCFIFYFHFNCCLFVMLFWILFRHLLLFVCFLLFHYFILFCFCFFCLCYYYLSVCWFFHYFIILFYLFCSFVCLFVSFFFL